MAVYIIDRAAGNRHAVFLWEETLGHPDPMPTGLGRNTRMAKLELSINVPPPFSFELTVKKPAGWHWGTPDELFEDGTLFTAMRLPGFKLVGLKAWEQEPGRVRVETFSRARLSAADTESLTAMLEMGLGAHEDLDAFYALGRRDPLVRRLIKDLYGMRPGFLVDVFERCLLAITLQMTPLKRSAQMRECLIHTFGDLQTADNKKIPYWPSPVKIATVSAEELMKRCLLGYRAKAIHRIAEAIAAGFPNIVELSRMDDEEIMRHLTSLYGVGYYSAQIISPHRGFPLDVWSARIFHEILRGTTPPDPRGTIKELEAEADRRWGRFKWLVFVYVLNDLPNLLEHYPITKMS